MGQAPPLIWCIGLWHSSSLAVVTAPSPSQTAGDEDFSGNVDFTHKARGVGVANCVDRFKKMADAGEIEPGSVEQLGYPLDFEQLINGVTLTKSPMQSFRFLRRIPVDPMTGEAKWGKRSVQDDPDATSWGRENLFDIYSKSDGTALDGTEYSTW